MVQEHTPLELDQLKRRKLRSDGPVVAAHPDSFEVFDTKVHSDNNVTRNQYAISSGLRG